MGQQVDKAGFEAAGMIAEKCGQAAYNEFVQSVILADNRAAGLLPQWEQLGPADRMTWQNVGMAAIRMYIQIWPELAGPGQKLVKGR